MTTIERSQVNVGRTAIAYSIARSARRSTVAIAIHPSDGVLLMAPMDAPVASLDRVVHTKARWILQTLRKQRDVLPPLPPREFVDGESFLYLGQQHRLRVQQAATPDVRLQGGRLLVGTPIADEGPMRAKQVRAALESWYWARAAEKLPERAEVWAHKLGMPHVRVVVRGQRVRWGSCDHKGTIRLNWRVIQAPLSLVDYVVAHEIVHLMHANHKRGFWQALGKAMPDYQERRQRLRQIGAALVW